MVDAKIETLARWIRETARKIEEFRASVGVLPDDWLASGARVSVATWNFQCEMEAQALGFRWDAFVEVWELLTGEKWPESRPALPLR